MAVFLNKYKKMINRVYFPKYAGVFFLCLFAGLAVGSPAFAVTDVGDIGARMVTSAQRLPGFISAISYLLALLFAVTGILKLKEHVEMTGAQGRPPLKAAIIRFLVGGSLLALPIVYEAMAVTINGGANQNFDPQSSLGSLLSSLLGQFASLIPQNNVNNVLENIIDSIENIPGFISAVAYLLGLVAGVSGLLKLKEHVENPDQTMLKEPVIRFLAGGALFAMPTIYSTMADLFGGDSALSSISSLFGSSGMIFSSYTGEFCNPLNNLLANFGLGGGTSLGEVLCGVFFNAGAFPAFLTALSYLIGLILGVWGVLKIKAHVLNPQQTALYEGVSRLVAGGAFFALPVVINVIRNTVTPTAVVLQSSISQATGFNEDKSIKCDGSGGLDGALYCLMTDVTGPMHVVINFFATGAGMVLAMIGISRLTKSAQEGARGPGGLGTIMTFAAAGALLSYNALMRTMTVSLSFTNSLTARTATEVELSYKGMSKSEILHTQTVISAVLKFMIIVGLISFVRGIFIIRNAAEGNSQASIMAGVTHMVGGALAVNLGPLIEAVETTLGLTGYGITFS